MAGVYIQPLMLSNLGAFLGMRFERTGSINDLNRAVDVVDQTVDDGVCRNSIPSRCPSSL
jgi:hypothetical protein